MPILPWAISANFAFYNNAVRWVCCILAVCVYDLLARVIIQNFSKVADLCWLTYAAWRFTIELARCMSAVLQVMSHQSMCH